MPARPKAQEPSMEEILDSIRRIISDEDLDSLPVSATRPMMPRREAVQPLEPSPRRYGRPQPMQSPGGSPHDEVGGGAPQRQATAPQAPVVQATRPPVFMPMDAQPQRAHATARAMPPVSDSVRAARMHAPGMTTQDRSAFGPQAVSAAPHRGVEPVARSSRVASAAPDLRPGALSTRASASNAVPLRAVSQMPPVRPRVVGNTAVALDLEQPAQGAVFAPVGEAAQRPVECSPAPTSAEQSGGKAAGELRNADGRGPAPRKDLLSPTVDAAVAATFRSLGDMVLPQQERTVEDLVKEILRPMLKDWLDQNLSTIVERLVRAEIERVTHTLR